ncbi:MAG TPA: hypothetical protein VN767_25905 [Streptosporangiaceae bacterium]|nr:hypothetical protein [Streptosporangiaceae bacterium]
MTSEHLNLMRERAGPQRVTGAARTGIQAAVLLIMVWQLWAYTTWVTNWLTPDLIAVRPLLLALGQTACMITGSFRLTAI